MDILIDITEYSAFVGRVYLLAVRKINKRVWCSIRREKAVIDCIP